MCIRVSAFSRNKTRRLAGILYELNLFSCMLASEANTNDECWKPTVTKVRVASSAIARRFSCAESSLIHSRKAPLFGCVFPAKSTIITPLPDQKTPTRKVVEDFPDSCKN